MTLEDLLSTLAALMSPSAAEARIVPADVTSALALRAAKQQPSVHDVLHAAQRRPEEVALMMRSMREAYGDYFPVSSKILIDPAHADAPTMGHELMHFLATQVRSPWQRSETLAEFAGSGGNPLAMDPDVTRWDRLAPEQRQQVISEYLRILGQGRTAKGSGRLKGSETKKVRAVQKQAKEFR